MLKRSSFLSPAYFFSIVCCLGERKEHVRKKWGGGIGGRSVPILEGGESMISKKSSTYYSAHNFSGGFWKDIRPIFIQEYLLRSPISMYFQLWMKLLWQKACKLHSVCETLSLAFCLLSCFTTSSWWFMKGETGSRVRLRKLFFFLKN